MSSTNIASLGANTKVVLKTPANWESWNEWFTSQAIGYDLWNYVTGEEQTIPKPIRPEMRDYPLKAAPAMARQTRSQTTTVADPADTPEIAQDTTPAAPMRPIIHQKHHVPRPIIGRTEGIHHGLEHLPK